MSGLDYLSNAYFYLTCTDGDNKEHQLRVKPRSDCKDKEKWFQKKRRQIEQKTGWTCK